MKNLFLLASSLILGVLALAQPAKAVIYDWQFTNVDGNAGSSTDVVAGFVEFSSFASFEDLASQRRVAADNFQIASVTGLTPLSSPFFGDGGLELNSNLVGDPSLELIANSFSFDSMGKINLHDIHVCSIPCEEEFLSETDDEAFFGFSYLWDSSDGDEIYSVDFSNDIFSQSTTASVPFEFSPTLGLFLAGGIFAGRSYSKRLQARAFTNRRINR